MCYAKPGPRCSAHAYAALLKAKAENGDVRTATKEYYTTPAGMAYLRQRGEHALADQHAEYRKKKLMEYTQIQTNKQLYAEFQARREAEEFADLRKARTQAVEKFEQLEAELDVLAKDKNTDFETLRQKKFAVRDAYYDTLMAKKALEEYKNETAYVLQQLTDGDALEKNLFTGSHVGNAYFYGEADPESPEWHKLRQSGIGGSDIKGILKLDEKYGRYDYEKVLDAKLSDDVEDEPDSEMIEGALDRGNVWEPVIASMFATKHPEFTVLHTKATWQNKDNPLQLANFDGLLSEDGVTPTGILEIKTGSDAREWENGVPVGYRAQVLWYLETTGLNYAHVAALIDDVEYKEFKIRRGEKINDAVGTIQDNMPKIEEFQEKVNAIRNGAPRTQKRSAHPAIKKSTSKSHERLLASYTGHSVATIEQKIADSPLSYEKAVKDIFQNEGITSQDLLFVDLETTGFDVTKNEIIELGWSRRDKDNNVLDEGNMLFSPDPRFLETRGTGKEEIHGINKHDVADEKSFRDPEVQERLREIFADSTVVAHNASFEERFLSQNIDGFKDDNHSFLDTMHVSKNFSTSENNTLKGFVEDVGEEYVDAHRALNDVKMTATAFFKFIKSYCS